MRIIVTLFIFLATIGSAESNDSSKPPYAEQVSMIQLIATPEAYDGKVVAVIGYLRLEFEGNELFLHEEDYKSHIAKNGIWVSVGPKMKTQADQLNMHYVLLIGTFNAKNKGHMNMQSGTLSADGGKIWEPLKTPSASTK
jgi:hypothetical protein